VHTEKHGKMYAWYNKKRSYEEYMGKRNDQSGKYSRTCEKVEVKRRRMDGRWTREILEWYPRGCERKQGRPSGRWADELRRMSGVEWLQISQDRQEWKRIGEAFIQQWVVNG
jgi:hypothetical protein